MTQWHSTKERKKPTTVFSEDYVVGHDFTIKVSVNESDLTVNSYGDITQTYDSQIESKELNRKINIRGKVKYLFLFKCNDGVFLYILTQKAWYANLDSNRIESTSIKYIVAPNFSCWCLYSNGRLVMEYKFDNYKMPNYIEKYFSLKEIDEIYMPFCVNKNDRFIDFGFILNAWLDLQRLPYILKNNLSLYFRKILLNHLSKKFVQSELSLNL